MYVNKHSFQNLLFFPVVSTVLVIYLCYRNVSITSDAQSISFTVRGYVDTGVNIRKNFTTDILDKQVYDLMVDNEISIIERFAVQVNQTVVTMGHEVPVQHYRDVCVDPSEPMHTRGYPFKGRIQVYDDRFRNSTIDYLRIATNIRTYYENNYWIDDFKNYSKPKRWKTHNSTAYFVPYWRGIANIYSSLELIVPKVNGQLRQSANLMTPEETTLNKTLVISTKGYMKDSVFSFIKALGFTSVWEFKKLVQAGPICFKHAIFGHSAEQNLTDIRKYQELWQKHLSINSTCVSRYVLVLQRTKSRSLLNTVEIVDALKGYGFEHVILVSFEDKPLSEQLQIIQCASVFIGVQGAGLAWYRFLPDNAIFIELFYRGWISKYKGRAQRSRPDLRTQAVYCKTEVPKEAWNKYEKLWFSSKNKTMPKHKMEEKIIAKSAQVNPVRGNIWKDSNLVCDPALIISALSSNLN